MSTTGYREVSRTMTTQATGQLPSTTREYQIEYLSPANSTTVPEERAPSPGVFNSSEYSSGLERHGNATSAYKTASYEYKSSTGSSANAALLRETADTLSQARAITDLGQSNIAELDTLLDDLNSAQRAGFNREYQITTTTSRDGYQPLPVQHISRSAQRSSQRSYSEQRYGSVNKDRQSPSPGPIRQVGSSSLDRGLTSSNSREVYSSSSRTTSPSPARRDIPPSPSAGRHIVEHNVYRSYDSRTGGGSSSTSTTTRYRDASPPRDRVRPPSPGLLPAGVGLPDYPVTGAAKVSTLVREYERRASQEEREASLTRRSPSPARSPVPRRKMMTSSTTYNYSSTSSSGQRPDPPRTPPPHRSPSPVSFPSPPEPLSGYSYRRDEMSSYSNSNTRQRSRSRSPPPRPFPTDHTVYHVDRVERVHREPVLQPRPFPTPSPTFHGDQRPPKELNELMSSFTETDMGHVSVRQHALDLEQRAQRQQQQAPPAPPTPPPARKEEAIVSRNVAGPPGALVLYAPRVFNHVGITSQRAVLGATILLGVVKTVSIVIPLFLADRLGRRPMLLTSAGGMAVSLLMLGLSLRASPMADAGASASAAWWAAATSVTAAAAFMATFSLGFGPVIWMYGSEILPLRLRAQGTGIGTAVNRVMSAVVGLTFISLYEAVGMAGSFYIFAGCAGASWVFVYVFLPETKGRSLEEMEALFDDSAKSPSLTAQ